MALPGAEKLEEENSCTDLPNLRRHHFIGGETQRRVLLATILILGLGAVIYMACQLYASGHWFYATELLVGFTPLLVWLIYDKIKPIDRDDWPVFVPFCLLMLHALAVLGYWVFFFLQWKNNPSHPTEVAEQWIWDPGTLYGAWGLLGFLAFVLLATAGVSAYAVLWCAIRKRHLKAAVGYLKGMALVGAAFLVLCLAAFGLTRLQRITSYYQEAYRKYDGLLAKVATIYKAEPQEIGSREVPIVENNITTASHETTDNRLEEKPIPFRRWLILRKSSPKPFFLLERHVPGYRIPADPKQVEMIVLLCETAVRVREYDSGTDYRVDMTALIIKWPENAVLASKDFVGYTPPSKSGRPGTAGIAYGSLPFDELAEWLKRVSGGSPLEIRKTSE